MGDGVVYLRRGHERALAAFADAPGTAPPPFGRHADLPMAVRCTVVEVAYVSIGQGAGQAEAEAAEVEAAGGVEMVAVRTSLQVEEWRAAGASEAAAETWQVIACCVPALWHP